MSAFPCITFVLSRSVSARRRDEDGKGALALQVIRSRVSKVKLKNFASAIRGVKLYHGGMGV